MDHPPSAPSPLPDAHRERFLKLASAMIFLVFFQTFMIAPLIPSLALQFGVTEQKIGLLIPAYTLPYAIVGLLCGALADRIGRRGMLFASLLGFPLLSFLMALAPGINSLIALRALSGACNVGMVVLSLTLVGDLFPPNSRGRAIGWLFGAIAGGSAFGSTAAGLLAPLIGWRGLFVLTAAMALLLLPFLSTLWRSLALPTPNPPSLTSLLTGYFSLLATPRAQRTYTFIFLNGMFHSGVFTWLGVLLHNRYNLDEAGIGLALLGYGVPGFLLGPAIGRIVDKHGRRRILPIGFAVAALSALLFVPDFPLPVAVAAATVLSLGFDMSHPLMAGIALNLDNQRRGIAMGLNTFAIFFGFGSGSFLFGLLTYQSLATALLTFAALQSLLAIAALFAFKRE